MNTMHNDPWTLMNGMRRNVDRLLLGAPTDSGSKAWRPPVDVREFDDRFEIVADIPGVPADQLDITLEDGLLTLAGARAGADAGEIHRSERVIGTFRRQFRLPESSAPDGLAAAYTNGVLTVTIPKRPQPVPHRIEVKAN